MKFAASLFDAALNNANVPQHWKVVSPMGFDNVIANPFIVDIEGDNNLGDGMKQILEWMGAQPTPEFHETLDAYWDFMSEDYDQVVIHAYKTSSANIIIYGNCLTDGILDTIFFGCDSTRGRVHQDFPDLGKWFPECHQWYFYDTTGPVRLRPNMAEEWDFESTILPWEDKADYLVRGSHLIANRTEYIEEVMTALKEVAFTLFYSADDVIKTVIDGTFYNGNLKSYQRKLLNAHFANNPERLQSAIRFVSAISKVSHAENCNLFA